MNKKLAVITGGATGIGKQISITLATHGWDIAFTWYGSSVEQENLVDYINDLAWADEAHGKAFAFRCDAGVKLMVDSFYEAVQSHYGRSADLLVNNAGTQVWASLLDLKEKDWDKVIQTNLKGCFLNTQTFSKRLISAKKPGCIINIGSGCNKNPFPELVSYTASKGGVELFTRSSAIELGQYDIRVNCLAPGAIEVERTLEEDPRYHDVWSAFTPLKRAGVPSDVADVVRFLASDDSRYVTGQTLYVDGGAFSQSPWPYH